MNVFYRILKLLRISSDLFTKRAALSPLFSRLKLSLSNNILATAAMIGIFYSSYENNETLSNGEKHSPSIFLSIIKVFMESVEVVLDIVENFIISAVVIEKKGLNNAVSKMQKPKDDYPEALAGGVNFEALNRVFFHYQCLFKVQ